MGAKQLTKADNPAGRLHDLVVAAKRIPSDKLAHEAWATLLNVEEQDTPNLLRRVGHVLEMPALIVKAVREVPSIDHDLHLEWMPKVEASLQNFSVNAKWQNFIQHYDDKTTYGIRICSDVLSRHRSESVLSDDDLQEIESLLGEVESNLESADLDASLRLLLRYHVAQMRVALVDYQLKGVVEIRRAFEASIGAVVLQPQSARDDLAATEAGKSFWILLKKIALTLSVMHSLVQIPAEVQKLLPDDVHTEAESGSSGNVSEGAEPPAERSEIDAIET